MVSAFAIIKLSLFANLLSKQNLDTALGLGITIGYLTSIVYLLSHSQRAASAKILLWVIFFIGCLGGIACYASVYSLHGLKCANGTDTAQAVAATYVDYLHYSAFPWGVGEPAGFCSPHPENKLLPTIEVFVILGYVVLSLVFLYRSSREK